MVRIVENLVGDWSHLDERIENVTDEIEALARGSESCRQLSIMARSKCAPFEGRIQKNDPDQNSTLTLLL
jgi:hypothetical protein